MSITAKLGKQYGFSFCDVIPAEFLVERSGQGIVIRCRKLGAKIDGAPYSVILENNVPILKRGIHC